MRDILHQMKHAFPLYPVPEIVTDRDPALDVDAETCQSVKGQTWKEVPADFWEINHSVYTALTPDAFVYYLPSIIICSMDSANEITRSNIIGLFDTSADIDIFPEFIYSRAMLLDNPQIKVIKLLTHYFAQHAMYVDKIQSDRVMKTLDMIEREMH